MQRDAADVAAYKRRGDWGETTVGDAVAGWARTRPDADAFVTVGAGGSADRIVTRTSWAQYDERATRLARVLAGGRLARGDRIAVVLPDGAAVHIAFVGRRTGRPHGRAASATAPATPSCAISSGSPRPARC